MRSHDHTLHYSASAAVMNHHGLFIKLMKRRIPNELLLLMKIVSELGLGVSIIISRSQSLILQTVELVQTLEKCAAKWIQIYTQSFYCSSGFCPGLPRWAGTRKVKPIWIYWSKRQWVAVASAGPYANLHLTPDNHANIPPLSFLQARCPSCCPTNSVKALKAIGYRYTINNINTRSLLTKFYTPTLPKYITLFLH